MNQDLEKRLLNYSAMAAAVSLFSFNSKAQCYYYDENPDVIITGHQQSFSIDFNNDSNIDLTFETLDATNTGTYLGYQYLAYYKKAILYGSGTISWIQNSSGMPNNLLFSSIINSSDNFSSGTGILAENNLMITTNGSSMFDQNGLWHGVTDNYLGFRFTDAGNLHYGWIRLDVGANAESIVIKDWGYQLTPDLTSQAGVNCNYSVSENEKELAEIYSIFNQIKIQKIKGTDGIVQIIDISGKVIYHQKLNANEIYIQTEDFCSGIYLVNITFKEGDFSKKVMIP